MANLSYEEEMFILGIYNSGITNMIDIVSKTGRSDDSIRKVLGKYGLSVSRKYTKITPEMRTAAKQMRSTGASYKDIAVQLHIGCSTVKRLLNDDATGYQQPEPPVQPEPPEHPVQLPLCRELKEIPIEALRMMRDALSMMIEAMTS